MSEKAQSEKLNQQTKEKMPIFLERGNLIPKEFEKSIDLINIQMIWTDRIWQWNASGIKYRKGSQFHSQLRIKKFRYLF